MTVAGMDVAHQTLAVMIRTGEKAAKLEEFANAPSGHRALLTRLVGAGVERLCLEATGAYHLDLALALDAGGLAPMVVNPKAAKRFAEALMARTKSDAVDAAMLAEFAQRMPFEPLRTAALAPIATEAALQDAFDLLASAKGIGAASAIQLLGEWLVLPPDMRAKPWAAMAGLDPRHATSGSSVNKKPRLSKAGNRSLRGALYMPALSATRRDKQVKGYYRHLIEDRGLKKIQAICAVMRQLLHAIHGMLKTGKPFDGQRFYVLPKTV